MNFAPLAGVKPSITSRTFQKCSSRHITNEAMDSYVKTFIFNNIAISLENIQFVNQLSQVIINTCRFRVSTVNGQRKRLETTQNPFSPDFAEATPSLLNCMKIVALEYTLTSMHSSSHFLIPKYTYSPTDPSASGIYRILYSAELVPKKVLAEFGNSSRSRRRSIVKS